LGIKTLIEFWGQNRGNKTEKRLYNTHSGKEAYIYQEEKVGTQGVGIFKLKLLQRLKEK